MFTLIENGDLYTPDPAGSQSVLLAGGKIVKIGDIDSRKIKASGLDCRVVNAAGCYLTPGFIDPHEHLLGAGGEQGFASRMPEVTLGKLFAAGITTVVGLVGTDTVTRTLTALLGKVRQLDQEGITAYMYTGGFPVPTPTITGSVRDDLILIDKVIGVGEIAIADIRSTEPSLAELARLVSLAVVGGLISGTAGVVHFHVGSGKAKLSLLHDLLDQHEIPAQVIYPTHITRSNDLMDDAIALAQRGAYVDTDVIEENLGQWLRYYQDQGGPLSQLTASSDAHTPHGSPAKLYRQFVSCVRDHGFALEHVLPLFTANVASVLKLPSKGRLQAAMDADLLVIEKNSFALHHVFAKGRLVVEDGQVLVSEMGED